MDTKAIPFGLVHWDQVQANRHEGESGFALWRDVDQGGLHVHMAEYSPGYKAAGWCQLGHILTVLKGSLTTELKDGREFHLTEGVSYVVSSDEQNPHRSRTETGATLFVVDLTD
jgi:hypothetical protein